MKSDTNVPLIRQQQIRKTKKKILGIVTIEETVTVTTEVYQSSNVLPITNIFRPVNAYPQVRSYSYPYDRVPTIISFLIVCALTVVALGWAVFSIALFATAGSSPLGIGISEWLFGVGSDLFVGWFTYACWKHVLSDIRSRLPMKVKNSPMIDNLVIRRK